GLQTRSGFLLVEQNRRAGHDVIDSKSEIDVPVRLESRPGQCKRSNHAPGYREETIVRLRRLDQHVWNGFAWRSLRRRNSDYPRIIGRALDWPASRIGSSIVFDQK